MSSGDTKYDAARRGMRGMRGLHPGMVSCHRGKADHRKWRWGMKGAVGCGDRLRQAGLEFEEEYEPFEKRFFALDIAFPDLKVAVEVNGNQHYDDPQTGKLQRYYQNRHDLLVEAGWRVLEIHYAFSFQEKAVDQVINAIRLRSSVGQ